MTIREINQNQFNQILENRSIRGLFILEDENGFIGLDNTTGDAWVEHFKCVCECWAWLKRK